MSFDVEEFRKKFPQLERTMGPNKLIYFDCGASSLKHSQVTDRVNSYNRFETSNVHRGAHHTSRQGTENYESARSYVKNFLNAEKDSEIIFTRGTTESINLVSYCFQSLIKENDEILITPFEHHSNIVPWQVLAEKTGAQLRVVPFNSDTGFTLDDFVKSISGKTKFAAFSYYSNSFGQRFPVEKMVEECKNRSIPCLIDGAQAPLTERIDVQALGCDFFAFSGHKMFAPYGVGALYMRSHWHETLPPYQTGGSMIDRVTFEKTTYADSPQKFEAGTPNIAGAIGLGEAAKILSEMDFFEMHSHVLNLRKNVMNSLSTRNNIDIYDFPASDHSGVVSFNVKGSHSSDVGTLLDKYGIAVRAGHHCTQPLMDLMGIAGTVRVSLAGYNTEQEIDHFLTTMEKIEEFF